jgi:hypothetical protein
MFPFDQFSALAVTYHVCQLSLASLGGNRSNCYLKSKVAEDKRSPEPNRVEDERLMDGPQKRNLAGRSTQTVKLSPDSRVQERFKA